VDRREHGLVLPERGRPARHDRERPEAAAGKIKTSRFITASVSRRASPSTPRRQLAREGRRLPAPQRREVGRTLGLGAVRIGWLGWRRAGTAGVGADRSDLAEVAIDDAACRPASEDVVKGVLFRSPASAPPRCNAEVWLPLSMKRCRSARRRRPAQRRHDAPSVGDPARSDHRTFTGIDNLWHQPIRPACREIVVVQEHARDGHRLVPWAMTTSQPCPSSQRPSSRKSGAHDQYSGIFTSWSKAASGMPKWKLTTLG